MPKPASFDTNRDFYTDLVKEIYNLDDISIESVSIGIQNYNFFIKDTDGNKTHFLSIKRYGQGEIDDKAHQEKLLLIQLKLAEKNVKLAKPIAGKNGLLETVPATIKGQPTPDDILYADMVLYSFLKGKSVDTSKPDLSKDFIDMGIQHGLFLQKGTEILRKTPELKNLQNPVSFESLGKMLVKAFCYKEERTIDSILASPQELQEYKSQIIKNLREKLKQDNNQSSDSAKLVETFIERVENGWYEKTLTAYQQDLEIYKRLTANMPKELLHGDMHFGNQFEKQGGIFDLDWMGVGHAFMDFCQPLVLNARDIDNKEVHFSPKYAADYLRGLEQHRPLTEFESKNLNKLIELTHWRSTATRLQSVINSVQISDITKSPVELTDLREKFVNEHSQTKILASEPEKPKFLQNALAGSNIPRY